MKEGKKKKFIVMRGFKKPRLVIRWLRLYLKRIKSVEDELGEEMHCC